MFILTSAELDTFSYDVSNTADLAAALASLLEVSQEEVLGYIAELQRNCSLKDVIARKTRWRPQYRWSPPLGRHVISYCIVRASRPPTVLELGIRHGLGSLVLLEALALNRSEGHPGELVSVDCDSTAGALVDEVQWCRTTGFTPDALHQIRLNSPIGFVISDTTPDAEVIRAEFNFALQHAHESIVLMQNHEWSTVLKELGQQHKQEVTTIEERALGHVVAGRRVDLLRILRPRDAL